MGDKIVRVLKKNLVAIITIVISMGVLLYFLFTTDGITALGHLVSSMRWEWLLITLGTAILATALEIFIFPINSCSSITAFPPDSQAFFL